VHLIAELLLRALLGWVRAHPHSALSRFMLKQRGPATNVRSMNRLQRLASALVFLFWGVVFLGLWLLTAYMAFGLHAVSPDLVIVQFLIFGLALLSGMGFLGGIYLLVRVVV
jgi:hypothetical protein